MSDVDLILQLQKELKADPNPPVLDVAFDPLDPIEIEMVLHEADFAIDGCLERYEDRYRPQFSDPTVYDNFVLEHKQKIRQIVRDAVAEAQEKIKALGYDAEPRDPFTEDSDA